MWKWQPEGGLIVNGGIEGRVMSFTWREEGQDQGPAVMVLAPDGQKFFSIARTVTAGGGGYGKLRVERAIALGCAAEHAPRLIYTDNHPQGPEAATPIGVTCRICHRTECTARSAPPIGRQILPEDIRRTSAPFGFSDT